MGARPTVRMRPMGPGDLCSVSRLGIRSKASWGYPPGELEIFASELTQTEESLRCLSDAQVAVTETGEIVGFFTLGYHRGTDVELEHLFVDPDCFGEGVGGLLLEAAQRSAAARGAVALTIISDPNAAGFYLKRGARQIGCHHSSIPGRQIPILQIEL